MKKIVKFICTLLCIIVVFTSLPIMSNAASADDIKNKVISIAQNEVGYTGTSTYSKYGEWYGYQGGWCTTFMLWCFNKAGESFNLKLYANIVPSGGNCNSMISWFQNRGRYHNAGSYTPKRGDLIFFDWSGNGSSQHVGIVKSVSGSTVYTIEGNCSGTVKEMKYTSDGKKPYNNISSIMGYGCPDYSGVANSKPAPTTNKPTTKATTKKQTTKATTKKVTQKPTTTKKPFVTIAKSITQLATTSTTQTTTTTTTTTETTQSTTQISVANDMELVVADTNLEIGDSVKLNYVIKPAEAKAVVGYFCDQEGIIEISHNGTISAVGEGTATVVVCANDEIYRQVDFNVTTTTVEVTKQKTKNDYVEMITTTTKAPTKKTSSQKLRELGVNVDMLKNNKEYYVIPLATIASTLVLGLMIYGIRKLVEKHRKKKEE